MEEYSRPIEDLEEMENVIAILNETNEKFKIVAGELKEGRENRHTTITYGKMKIEAFIKDQHIKKLDEKFQESSANIEAVAINNTRLYFNNKHFKPIIVGDAKSQGADFLLFVQKVQPTERLAAVDHKNSAFVLESQRVKGEFIAGIISFSISRPSSVTFITVDGDKYKYTTYSSDGKGNIERTVVQKEVSSVKELNPEMRAGIKPYRPFKPTHLVMVSDKNLKDAESFFGGKNHHLVPFKNNDELRQNIESYKSKGFTAATLYVPYGQDEEISAMEKTQLQLVVDAFKVAHLTYGTGFTKFHSKPPVPAKRPFKKKPSKDSDKVQKNKPEGNRRQAHGKKQKANK